MSGLVRPLMLANDPIGASSFPTWSKNGEYLSFGSNRTGGAGSWDLYLARIEPMTGADDPAVPLTEANSVHFEHAARWSP